MPVRLEQLEGEVIADRFRLLEIVGQGGYGAVFDAEQISMGRRCAVKVLLPSRAHDQEVEQRFRIEARATSRMTHPNTVVVYDFGIDEATGFLFLATEYLDGHTLHETLETHSTLPVGPAVSIMEQVAGSLADAHAQGLIHRDVKPRNIMLVERAGRPDFVKVIDFGIAKALEGELAEEGDLTETGMLVGTPGYIAPECLLGEEFGPGADQYALATVGYRMLTGRNPFRSGAALETAISQVHDPPLPLTAYNPALDVPPAFEDAFFRALEKEPADRFTSIVDFVDTLREILPEEAPGRSDGPGLDELHREVGRDEDSDTERFERRDGSGDHPESDRQRGLEPEEYGGTAELEQADTAVVASGDGTPPGLETLEERGTEPEETPDAPGTTAAGRSENPGLVPGEAAYLDDTVNLEREEARAATAPVERSTESARSTRCVEGRSDQKETRAVERAPQSERGDEGPHRWLRRLVLATGVLFVATFLAGTMIVADDYFAGPGASDDETRDEEGAPDERVAETPDSSPGDDDEKGADPVERIGVDQPVVDLDPALQPVGAAVTTARREAKRVGTAPDTGESPVEEDDEVRPATLEVTLIPWGTLYVDGARRSDATRQQLTVEPGRHRLTMRQQGEERVRRVVDVAPGESKMVILEADFDD